MNTKKAFTLVGFPLLLVSAFFLFIPFASATTAIDQPLEETLKTNSTGGWDFKIITGLTNPTNVDYIKIKLKNNEGSTKYLQMRIGETSPISSNCNTIAAGETKEVIFTFATATNIYDQFVSLFINNGACAVGTRNALSFTYYGSTAPTYSVLESFPANWGDWFPYILARSGFPLTINDPGLNVPIIGPTLWSGTCPVNGTNQLYLTTDNYYSLPNDVSDFNVDCVDHEWQAVKQVLLGQQTNVIIDKAWLTTKPNVCPSTSMDLTACITFNGIDENFKYNLKIIYPECSGGIACINLEDNDDWIFRFQYTIPDDIDLSTIRFRLESCTNETCSSHSNQQLSLLSDLDPEQRGYVDTEPDDIIVSTKSWYMASLESTIPTVYFEIKFYTEVGDGTDDIPFVQPGTEDLGFWGNLARSLFVPSRRTVLKFTQDFPDRMRGKIPFAYFYEITSRITDLDSTEQTLVINLPITLENVSHDFKILDTGNEDVQTLADSFRTVLSFAFWISLLVYFYERVKHFEI